MPLLVHPGLTLLPGRRVRFTLHRPGAHTVRLAANFTRWSAQPLALERSNAEDPWEAETPALQDGVHFYKYIVDGLWIHDPAHPMVEPDGCGGWNSVFGLGGPGLGEADDLRIATLNLRTYQEAEPLLKLEQVAFALAVMDVDAVALQEVGEHLHDPGQPNAGEVIRTRLQALTGRAWSHAWRMAHVGFDVYREGISLLCATPLEDVREHRLSQGRLARNALSAAITVKGASMRLASTHLTWPSGGGLREVQALLDELRGLSSAGMVAQLVAGDLDAEADDPQVRALVEADFVDIGRDQPFPTALPQKWQTFSAPAVGFVPATRIDYQMLRPLAGTRKLTATACVPIFNGLVAGELYQPRVSDHIGVLGVYRVA